MIFSLCFCIDLSKRSVKFTESGDGIETYDIFQYQIINKTSKLDYVTIGEYGDNDLANERFEKTSISCHVTYRCVILNCIFILYLNHIQVLSYVGIFIFTE